MWLSENPASAARRPGVSTQFRSVSVSGGTMFLIGITFNDHSEVPETGSTWGLLFLSLIGLLGATRLRSLQSA